MNNKYTYENTSTEGVKVSVEVDLQMTTQRKDRHTVASILAAIELNTESLCNAVEKAIKSSKCPVRVGDYVDRNSAVIDIDGLYSFPINKELSTLVVTEISVSSRTFIARALSGAIYNMSWDAVGTIVSICQPKDVRVYIPMFGMCNVRVATLDRSSVILTPVNQETSKKYYHLVNLTLLDDTDSKKLKNFLGGLLEEQQH